MVLVVAFHSTEEKDRLIAFTLFDTHTGIVNVHRLPAEALTQKKAEFALHAIGQHAPEDVVTFNGSGFGFRLLWERIRACCPFKANSLSAEIALLHTDIFADFALDRGYMISLDAACKVFTAGCICLTPLVLEPTLRPPSRDFKERPEVVRPNLRLELRASCLILM